MAFKRVPNDSNLGSYSYINRHARPSDTTNKKDNTVQIPVTKKVVITYDSNNTTEPY